MDYLRLSFYITAILLLFHATAEEFSPPGATKIATSGALELPEIKGYIKKPREDWNWYKMPETADGKIYACISPARKLFIVAIRRSSLDIRKVPIDEVLRSAADTAEKLQGKVISQEFEYIPLLPHETALHAVFQIQNASTTRTLENYILATGTHLLVCLNFPEDEQDRKEYRNFVADIQFERVSQHERQMLFVGGCFFMAGFVYFVIAILNRMMKRPVALESKWAFYTVVALVALRVIAASQESADSAAHNLGVGLWPLLVFGVIYYKVKRGMERKF